MEGQVVPRPGDKRGNERSPEDSESREITKKKGGGFAQDDHASRGEKRDRNHVSLPKYQIGPTHETREDIREPQREAHGGRKKGKQIHLPWKEPEVNKDKFCRGGCFAVKKGIHEGEKRRIK